MTRPCPTRRSSDLLAPPPREHRIERGLRMRIGAVDRRGHRAGRCGGERRQRQAFGVARAAPHAQKAARSGEGAPTMTDETLAQFRQSIDNIDAALVFLLAERFRITKAVGRYKAIEGLPPEIGRAHV